LVTRAMELAGVGQETELRHDKAVPRSPLFYRVYLDNFDTLQKVNPSAAALLEGRPNGASLALRSVYEEFNVPRNVKKTVEQQLVAEMQGALRVALDVLQAPVGGCIAVESDAGARRVVEANFADVLQLSSVEEVRSSLHSHVKRIIDLVRRPRLWWFNWAIRSEDGVHITLPKSPDCHEYGEELELWAADSHRFPPRTPGRPEHINKLELRALFTALKWRIQKQQRLGHR
ncbi:unnamed protein product, partial [Effrenium voratum]